MPIGWRLPRIFVSYRRDDSALHARTLYEQLVDHFGREQVFFDVEEIDYGDRFATIIDDHIAQCDVVVAVVGPQWLTVADAAGRPRLFSERDYVRREIATALRAGKKLIPVLVGGAKPPQAADLPADIAGLAARNALSFDDRELGEGIDRLVDAIRGQRAARIVTRMLRLRTMRFAATAVALGMLFAAWLSLFDLLALDTRSASLTLWLADLTAPEPVARELQLITVDRASETALGTAFEGNPAARREHARLVGRLARAGARSVVFDLFVTRPSEADDAVLAQAVREARAQGTAVVFVARSLRRDGQPAMVTALRDAVTAWAMPCIGQRLGYTTTVPLIGQREPAVAASASASAPAPARAPVAGLALAAAYAGPVTSAAIVEGARQVVVSGRPDGAARAFGYSEVETVDAAQGWCPVLAPGDRVATAFYRMAPLDALRGDDHRLGYAQALALDDEALRRRYRGATVLVGLTLPGADEFAVFRGWRDESRHGLEIHADAASALLRDAVVRPLGWVGDFALMLAAGLVAIALRGWLPRERAWARRAALAAVVAGCLALAVAGVVVQGRLVNVTYVVGALLVTYAVGRRLDAADDAAPASGNGRADAPVPAGAPASALTGAPAMAPAAALVGLAGPFRGVTIPLPPGGLELGRAPAGASLLSFPENSDVSRRHCAIAWDAARQHFRVTDLGSSNGTFVLPREQRLAARQEALVAPGQSVRLGRDSVFRLDAAGAQDR